MGAKNEVSAPHPATALLWRVAAIRPAGGKFMSLAVIPEGLRDVWCISAVPWCVTCMGYL